MNKIKRMSRAMMRFHIEREQCLLRFHELAELIDIVEQGMKDRLADWRERFESLTKSVSDDEFIDRFYDDLVMVRDKTPNLIRHALFVMVIALLEKVVADLCFLFSRVDIIKKRPKSRLYLRTSQCWLLKTASFPKSDFGSEWKACLRATALRHVIVHNAGQFPRDSSHIGKKPRSLAKWHVDHSENVSLSKYGYIMIDRGFCENTLQNARIAYEKLMTRGVKLAANV